MNRNEKGFSLVELLVVVAIISVLAGVGIIGFQRYTETAKIKVSLQNLGTVNDFFSTELILINNNIVDESPLIKNGNSSWIRGINNLDSFLNGGASYHDLGFGLGNFKNPFSNRTTKQVYSMSNPDDNNSSNLTNKGNIVLRVHPSFSTDGSKIAGDRQFQVVYYKDDGVIDAPRTHSFTLK